MQGDHARRPVNPIVLTREAVCFKTASDNPWSVREKGVALTDKRSVKKRGRPGIRLVVALVAGTIVMTDWTVAEAFDFFGLFGSDDKPPEVSRAAIPYMLTVQVAGDPSGLKDAVRDASSLYSLRKDAPPDGEARRDARKAISPR